MTTKIISKKEKGMNRHWKNFLDKDYLGAHNLEKGEEMRLTIDKFVGEEKVKTADGTKVKTVLYFKEQVPKMILNITNGNTISALYGTHPENWAGKQIQVYVTPVKAFGGVQDALRIRDVIPKRKIDNSLALTHITEATGLEDLKTRYLSLTIEERNDLQVVKLTNELKAKYANPQ